MIRLNRRERLAVTVGTVCVIVFVAVQFVILPLKEKREQLERSIAAKSRTLGEMAALKAEYTALRAKAERAKVRMADRQSGFTLFSFLDALAEQAGVKDNITYMKPSRVDDKDSPYRVSMVEMKLQNINLKQLLPYLYKVETSKNIVFIRRISITKVGKDEHLIDAVLQVQTFEI